MHVGPLHQNDCACVYKLQPNPVLWNYECTDLVKTTNKHTHKKRTVKLDFADEHTCVIFSCLWNRLKISCLACETTLDI